MALDRRRLYKVGMIDRSSAWFRAFVCCLLLAFTSGALANASAAVGIVLCVALSLSTGALFAPANNRPA